ncbi:MAG: alpha/beta hydrolase [Thermoflexaceae bacterium]|nr:alpha/beta hydrolase [Thermoflexaceae bacterium]
MRVPAETRVKVNGVELALFEWPGEGRPIFLAHATGFHARCWDQVAARLPGRHLYAVDMRGHGRSEKPAPPYLWLNFAQDVAALARSLGLRDALGVGHSKGGYAVARAAAMEPGAFAKLLLIDPVIMPRPVYAAFPLTEHFASRRRNEWSSPEEMFERFRSRAPFDRWDPAVLRDYCAHGLLPAPSGDGFVLACPPAIEAATYLGSAGGDPYDDLESLTIPVRVLRARARAEGAPMDMSGSPTNPRLVEHLEFGEDVYLPEYSHFIPMEAPGLVARHIEEMA